MKPRVDQLTAPPVIGQFYSVPTVHGTWCGKTRWWTVMGTIHDDLKFFAFEVSHYHLDRRFLSNRCDLRTSITSPLHRYPYKGQNSKPLSDIVWRPRKCLRADPGFPFTSTTQVEAMQASLSGAQCARDQAGWICPHRGFSLGSIEPTDGVILCPMHGLQINAATGVVVAPR